MAALGKYLRTIQGGSIGFMCPGCDEVHVVQINSAERPSWSFDGNSEAPTFAPSVLCRTGKFVPGFEDKHKCGTVCHSFVRNGKIEFLNDCTHALAGKTVEMVPFPYENYGGDA